MVHKYKIMFVFLFISFTKNNWIKKEKEYEDIIVSVFQNQNKEKAKNYVIIIRGVGIYKNVLDSTIHKDLVYFQNRFSSNIKLVLNNSDTILPSQYIFEDNISGILPYYKFLVTYNERKGIKNRDIFIKILDKERIIKIN